MDTISLKNDLSVKEMEDFNQVRTMRKNPKNEYPNRPSLRACAMAMLEEGVMNAGKKVLTPEYAKIAGIDSTQMYQAGLIELSRLNAACITPDFGSSYLFVDSKPTGNAAYRLAALRSYFLGEPASAR